MNKYRKLIASILATIVAVLGVAGIDTGAEGTLFGIDQDVLVTAVVGILGSFGVWALPNDNPNA